MGPSMLNLVPPLASPGPVLHMASALDQLEWALQVPGHSSGLQCQVSLTPLPWRKAAYAVLLLLRCFSLKINTLFF